MRRGDEETEKRRNDEIIASSTRLFIAASVWQER
jgi:hypothetical protein